MFRGQTATTWRAAGQHGALRVTSSCSFWRFASRPHRRLRSHAGRNGITPPSIATSLPNNGDPGGVRKDLAAHGVTYTVYYTNDVLANVHGGNRRGAIDQGKLEGALTIDLDKAAGWQGLSFFTNGFAIHNTGRIRRDYVGGINTIAAIEAVPTMRLSELWLEQKLLGGKASVRFGQLAADAEFFFSGLSSMFLQSDWATIAAENLPSGGPAYPLSTPGARLKIRPDRQRLVAARRIQRRSRRPRRRRSAAAQPLRPQFPCRAIPRSSWARRRVAAIRASRIPALPARSRSAPGATSAQFDDRRFANDGTLLADPAGSGEPAQRKGNSGIYARDRAAALSPRRRRCGKRHLGVQPHLRQSIRPQSDRLLRRWRDHLCRPCAAIARTTSSAPSFIYSRFSDGVRAFDRDKAAFTGVPVTPSRLRGQSRAQLPDPDHPGLDRAAKCAVHLASERRCGAAMRRWWARARSGDFDIPQAGRSALGVPAPSTICE